ncbi:protein lin-37 homolog [Musca vetustissima]|uniref:protein lin-37 homolog n=1 Tax=Musca vetustissima TaxID=27455 RepID=UPI002AB62391|nr:protein lin-37 homolog [Musca vetustissima]
MKTPPQRRKQLSESEKHRLKNASNEKEPQQQQPVARRPQRGRPRKKPLPQNDRKNSPPPSTPSKKRRRELATSAGQNKIQAESFVMKLFDRTLDLSKYTEQTALYPICRAWMANQPRNPNIPCYRETRSPSPAHRDDNGLELVTKLRKGQIREVTSLPKPKETDLPKIAPQSEPKRYGAGDDLIAADDPIKYANKNELLGEHLMKWKRIKSDWQKHTKRYQQRNNINFYILQELFKP